MPLVRVSCIKGKPEGFGQKENWSFGNGTAQYAE